MKTTAILFLAYLALCVQCSVPENKSTKKEISTQPIKVGVFDGHGGAQTCIWETVAAIRLDPEMEVCTITTADIANNVLDYTCIQLNGQQAIDIEHDNRGHGLAKFTLCEEGKKIFPELADRDTSFVIYYEGPVFINNPADTIQSNTLAIMESDVHEEGNAPANMTNGKPFFVANNYGKGRVFSSIAHPEGTPGMMWMIPRMVRWTLNKPFIPYQSSAVRPDLFNHESLMATDDLKQEEKAFQILLSGESEQKVAALDWLEAHHSWDAKRWVQGLLYDASPAVRIRAARYIADTHYLPFLPNLQAAYRTETDKATQEELKTQLEKLTALLP